MSTKQLILDFIQAATNGATYTDLRQLGFCRATLRRWVMELERDGLIERQREHARARAVFLFVGIDDMTFVT